MEYEEYHCNRGDSYTQTSLNHQQNQSEAANENNINNVFAVKKRNRKESIKINCPAKIIVQQKHKGEQWFADWIYHHNHDFSNSYYHNSRLSKKLVEELRISIQQQTPIVEIINSMLDPIYRSCQNVALKLKQIVVFEDKQRQKAIHDLIIKDLQHILFNPEILKMISKVFLINMHLLKDL